MEEQPAAAAQLHERWPESLYVLKTISSRALADGYYFGALVLVAAAAISLWAFSGVAPKGEAAKPSDPVPVKSTKE